MQTKYYIQGIDKTKQVCQYSLGQWVLDSAELFDTIELAWAKYLEIKDTVPKGALVTVKSIIINDDKRKGVSNEVV